MKKNNNTQALPQYRRLRKNGAAKIGKTKHSKKLKKPWHMDNHDIFMIILTPSAYSEFEREP